MAGLAKKIFVFVFSFRSHFRVSFRFMSFRFVLCLRSVVRLLHFISLFRYFSFRPGVSFSSFVSFVCFVFVIVSFRSWSSSSSSEVPVKFQ